MSATRWGNNRPLINIEEALELGLPPVVPHNRNFYADQQLALAIFNRGLEQYQLIPRTLDELNKYRQDIIADFKLALVQQIKYIWLHPQIWEHGLLAFRGVSTGDFRLDGLSQKQVDELMVNICPESRLTFLRMGWLVPAIQRVLDPKQFYGNLTNIWALDADNFIMSSLNSNLSLSYSSFSESPDYGLKGGVLTIDGVIDNDQAVWGKISGSIANQTDLYRSLEQLGDYVLNLSAHICSLQAQVIDIKNNYVSSIFSPDSSVNVAKSGPLVALSVSSTTPIPIIAITGDTALYVNSHQDTTAQYLLQANGEVSGVVWNFNYNGTPPSSLTTEQFPNSEGAAMTLFIQPLQQDPVQWTGDLILSAQVTWTPIGSDTSRTDTVTYHVQVIVNFGGGWSSEELYAVVPNDGALNITFSNNFAVVQAVAPSSTSPIGGSTTSSVITTTDFDDGSEIIMSSHDHRFWAAGAEMMEETCSSFCYYQNNDVSTIIWSSLSSFEFSSGHNYSSWFASSFALADGTTWDYSSQVLTFYPQKTVSSNGITRDSYNGSALVCSVVVPTYTYSLTPTDTSSSYSNTVNWTAIKTAYSQIVSSVSGTETLTSSLSSFTVDFGNGDYHIFDVNWVYFGYTEEMWQLNVGDKLQQVIFSVDYNEPFNLNGGHFSFTNTAAIYVDPSDNRTLYLDLHGGENMIHTSSGFSSSWTTTEGVSWNVATLTLSLPSAWSIVAVDGMHNSSLYTGHTCAGSGTSPYLYVIEPVEFTGFAISSLAATKYTPGTSTVVSQVTDHDYILHSSITNFAAHFDNGDIHDFLVNWTYEDPMSYAIAPISSTGTNIVNWTATRTNSTGGDEPYPTQTVTSSTTLTESLSSLTVEFSGHDNHTFDVDWEYSSVPAKELYEVVEGDTFRVVNFSSDFATNPGITTGYYSVVLTKPDGTTSKIEFVASMEELIYTWEVSGVENRFTIYSGGSLNSTEYSSLGDGALWYGELSDEQWKARLALPETLPVFNNTMTSSTYTGSATIAQ